MKRILLLMLLPAAVGLFSSLPGKTPSQSRSIDELVLDGAKQELANETRYNPQMLWQYYPPRFKDGEKQQYNVYPMGDVAPNEGVCTDLIVRACRNAGYDLQQMVHEDILKHREYYGIETPDKYIDHRRVWVLLKFFQKNYKSLPKKVDQKNEHWQAGDIVIWDVGSNHHMHTGIISDKRTRKSNRPFVIHNNRYLPLVFPGKTCEQDVLRGPRLMGMPVRVWKVAGHFRLSEPKLKDSLQAGNPDTTA